MIQACPEIIVRLYLRERLH